MCAFFFLSTVGNSTFSDGFSVLRHRASILAIYSLSTRKSESTKTARVHISSCTWTEFCYCWKGFSCCCRKGLVAAGKGLVIAGKGLVVAGKGLIVAGKGLVVAVERVYSSCCWNLSVCLFVMIAGKGSVVAGTSYLLLERV